ncbi:MAG: hypothetical protein AAF961_14060 [Planctomycetota bacterium]
MRLDEDQLEWVVREVVRRLATVGGRASISRDARNSADDDANVAGVELTLGDRVVSTSQLDGRLSGVSVVRVARRAVVTPAARDMLADAGATLVRDVELTTTES